MKLKCGIITDHSGDDYIAVATGEASRTFNGLIRNNKTADFLFQKMMTDTTEDSLVEALLQKYVVSEEIARRDVQILLAKLRSKGLLDE